MKKLFAALAVVFFALSLTACNFVEPEKMPSSVTPDGGGAFYTPLDIDLIYTGENGFELRIGVYEDALAGAFSDDFSAIGTAIGDKIGKEVVYSDFNFFTDVTEDVYVDDEPILETQNVYYYSYKIEGEMDFEVKERHFGFFNYRYSYEIVGDEFLDKIFPAVVSVMKDATAKFGSYTVDDKATSVEFGLCVSADLSAENATWVRKRLKSSQYNYCECLVYKGDVSDKFSVLEAELFVPMSSGWYIVPILLGLAAVAMVLIISHRTKKDKKDRIFRDDPQREGFPQDDPPRDNSQRYEQRNDFPQDDPQRDELSREGFPQDEQAPEEKTDAK